MTPEDAKTLEQRGITSQLFDSQIKRFETGFPYLRIVDSARIGSGITSLDDEGRKKAVERWDKFLADGGEVY